jgi:Outer membrane protein beta-barrel domain
MMTTRLVAYAGLTLSLLSAAPAVAQMRLGLMAGANASNLNGSYEGSISGHPSSSSSQKAWGPHVGVVLQVPVVPRLALQTAVVWSQKVGTDDFKMGASFGTFGYSIEGEAKSRVNYLEVPLLAVWEPDPNHGFQFIAGGYVGIGINGRDHLKVRVKDFTGDTTAVFDLPTRFDSHWDDLADDSIRNASTDKITNIHASFRRVDVGVSVGMGYRFKAFQVQAIYQHGLRNLSPTLTSGTATVHLRGFNLTAAYLFSRRSS